MANRCEHKSTWATGGGLLAGLGAGFFFLPESALAFVGCLLVGLGAGLVITPVISLFETRR
jgi:ferredoxin-NADP reductase